VIERVRRYLSEVTNGGDPFPLAILFLLFFFDEFDTAAFNVLAPNIEKAFGLTDRQFLALVVGNLGLVLLAAIPIGYYADRLPRVPLVVAGGFIAGIFSFFTGIVPGVAALVLVRLGNGVGRMMNDSIHTSLLSDYYAPSTRPRVFSTHRNGEFLGRVIGPAIAGLAAVLLGWRWAFVILIVPIGITAFITMRLAEPLRGGTDDPDAAMNAEKEAPVPFREAVRTLFGVPTLKRQYWAFFFIGAGLLPLAVYLPLYLDRVFGVGDFWRGIITAGNAGATFLGVQKSGRWTMAWFAQGMGEPLKRAGLALVGVGVGLAAVAATPWLAGVVLLGLLTSFVAGVFTPPFYATQAFVSPARVRTLSFSFTALFVVLGTAVLFFVLPVAKVSDTHGIRWGIAATVPYWIIGGLVLRTAHRFVAADAARAIENLQIAASMRGLREDAASRALLVCRGVSVAYDSVQVLFGVDMEVREGEVLALLGTNGAGKSTLLKAVSGIVGTIGGSIFLAGRDITHADPMDRAKAGIVQVPGGRGVFPTLTVAEHFEAAAWLIDVDAAELAQRREEVLDRFPRLRERYGQLAGNLSGGEQQMLALGMAFVARPRLLIIDELSLGLAPTIVEQLLDIVREIHDQGTTIILVEQSLNVALTIADRAYFMEKGEVRFEGTTAELMERDDIVRSVFLEGAAKATGARTGTTRRRRRSRIAAPAPIDGPVVLETRALSRSFGGIRAVSDVDLVLREGEILGLIGPNGAGKTTIFDLISGFVVPDRGHVELCGADVTRWSPDQRARAGLGRSFQDARIFPSMTVAENLAMGLERHLPVRDHVAAALGMPAVRELEIDVSWTVADLVELMGLGAFRDKFVSELSTGSRRVVDLAMSIAHDPTVLLLDEPSSGIAQRETEALGPLLQRIRQETGCSMLVIEHDMPLITSVSDEIIALELGQVIARGRPHEVVNDARVVASYLGTDEAVINRSGASR
jgi:branched-chain amino acid transport system ATP-binding protein